MASSVLSSRIGLSERVRTLSSEYFRTAHVGPSSSEAGGRSSISSTKFFSWRFLSGPGAAFALALAFATASRWACCSLMPSSAAFLVSSVSTTMLYGRQMLAQPMSVMRLRPRPRYSRPRYFSRAVASASAARSQMRFSQRLRLRSCHGHSARASVSGASSRRVIAQARREMLSRQQSPLTNSARARPTGSALFASSSSSAGRLSKAARKVERGILPAPAA
mmetsp:Transcript_68612/g.201368  ORF Transcript_68612/g.201368 Transcript_68612/m.201368 type:complete len:221 (-) Transcript_68612:978-1640(-)